MGKKRVPISIRKPPSPEAPRTETPVGNDVVARAAAEPEVHLAQAVVDVAPAVDVAPPVEVGLVADAAPVNREPALEQVSAPAPLATVATLATSAPPLVLASRDGRPTRAVTVYLPAYLVDRLERESEARGQDAVREAIEATVGVNAARFVSASAAGTITWRWAGRVFDAVARVEGWIERGRSVVRGARGVGAVRARGPVEAHA